MAFIQYRDQPVGVKPATEALISHAYRILEDLNNQGYKPTLRQLYYQFVSADLIPNSEQSYDRLGRVVSDAREFGLLDWDWMEDRMRSEDARRFWDHPSNIIRDDAREFHLSFWTDQPVWVEVWVEKDALSNVVERACRGLDVTSLACRGYMSQSAMHESALRLLGKIQEGKRIVILHLGDHDPSGIDMSRDNEDRLRRFIGHHLEEQYNEPGWDGDNGREFDWDQFAFDHAADFELPEPETPSCGGDYELFRFERIALNMDQVRQYNPPPNPAKLTDSRAGDYVARFGSQSWELDALTPAVLAQLIQGSIGAHMDVEMFNARVDLESAYQRRIIRLLELHGDVLDNDEDAA